MHPYDLKAISDGAGVAAVALAGLLLIVCGWSISSEVD
jgi:hypothetical protein